MAVATSALAGTDPWGLALADERQSLSWRALDDRLDRAVGAMLAHDFRAERRAAVFAPNAAEPVLALLAGLHAGLSMVPVSFHLKADELAYILRDSGAEILFVGPETRDVALVAAALTGGIRVIGWRCTGAAGLEAWEDWLATGSPDAPHGTIVPRPYLQYTSGTTGRPKSIESVPATMPLADTVEELFVLIRDWASSRPEGPHLLVAPLYHNGPISSVRYLAAGRPVVAMARFDAEAVLATIAHYRIASSVMVPTHFRRLLALPEAVRNRHDISSLRQIVHTGAACPVAVKRAMIDWFGPVLTEVYGGTESGAVTSISSEEWLAHPGSVGRVLDQFELEIFAEDGGRLGANEPGQLFFRDRTGRGIVYRGDPERSAAAHREPGMFTLGDVGFADDDGFVYITDRVSDMIVSGGVNIYPAEIEQLLAAFPGIADIAVIGVPSEDMGEEAKALVVAADPGAPPVSDDILTFCRARLASYKCPRSVEIVRDIGRNALGKIDKRRLRAPYWPSERMIG